MNNDLKSFSNLECDSQASLIILSIIVPCFNEINNIEKIIQSIKNSPIKNKEIIIIDDGSTDGSKEYLENLNDNSLSIVFHPFNKGKGSAISSGIKLAKGKIIIIQDADLEYDPQEYPLLIQPILG